MMDANLKNNRLITEQKESENTPESGPDSPPSSLFNDTKVAATSSPKRSKRGGSQKRVVSVPIKDVEGSWLRGENAPPPSDSWAWRKYGQKPIKGSPYPRGYYRCSSSSKGCPARKQVERSTVDPATLLVTYSCEHNHPWPPPSRSNHHRHHRHHHHHHYNNPSSSSSSSASFTAKPHPAKDPEAIKPESPGAKPENHFAADIAGDEPLVTIEEFAWFGRDDHQTWTSSTILDGPIFAEELRSADVGLFPMMREEDELLFADLGELPECSSVFRSHRGVGPQVQIC